MASNDSVNPPSRSAQIFPIRRDARMAALTDKLVASRHQQPEGRPAKATRAVKAPDLSSLKVISDEKVASISDAQSMMQILPDTDLAMQILVGSILSPKDMVTVEIIYSVRGSHFTSDLTGRLIKVVKDHFETSYKIADLLQPILEDALFNTGSYVLAVLPENTIDDLINSPLRVSTESLGHVFSNTNALPSLGFLGNPNREEETKGQGVGLEAFQSLLGRKTDKNFSATVSKLSAVPDLADKLTILDNFTVLKMPLLRERIYKDRVAEAFDRAGVKVSLEKHDPGNLSDNEPSIYPVRRYTNTPILAATPSELLQRQSVGNPMVMNLPSECVIPVHVPGNPSKHVGYFVLLDENGNPLAKATGSDYYKDLGNRLNSTDAAATASALLQQTQINTNGRPNNATNGTDERLKQLDMVYASIVESELQTRLQYGLYGNNVEISKDHEVYRIMLARALARMHTQVLYLPAELVSYFAFDYNAWGVGVSLLDKSKILGSLRATMAFANAMASVKNAVGLTTLAIQFDPEDPDPTKTVDELIHHFASNTRARFPVGVTRPSDIIDYMQMASIQVTTTGNERYPQTQVNVEERAANRTKPDPDTEKSLRDQYIRSLGLMPETIDGSGASDFATTQIFNNLLMTKRVMMYQKTLMGDNGVTGFVRKYVRNSTELRTELRDIIQENQKSLTDEHRQLIKETETQLASGMRPFVPQTNPATETPVNKDTAISVSALDRLVDEFIDALMAKLPEPDTTVFNTQASAYDQYTGALDNALNAYLNPDFMDSETMGEVAAMVNPIRAAIKAHYSRQWMRNNNYMPELDDLVNFDEDGPALDLFDANSRHAEALQKSLLKLAKEMSKNKKKADEQMSKIQEETGQSMGEAPSGGEDTTTDAGDTGDVGGDDFDTGFDAGETDTADEPASGEDTETDQDDADETEKPDDTEEPDAAP